MIVAFATVSVCVSGHCRACVCDKAVCVYANQRLEVVLQSERSQSVSPVVAWGYQPYAERNRQRGGVNTPMQELRCKSVLSICAASHSVLQMQTYSTYRLYNYHPELRRPTPSFTCS